MKLTPLVIHAGIQLPRHTALFSDALPVTSMAVVADGLTTLACPAPHGVQIGAKIAISITDVPTPNAVSAASINDDGDIVITTAVPHDLSMSSDVTRFHDYHTTVEVAGFTSSDVNGIRQLVSIPDRNTVVFKPAAPIISITLTGSERILERLEEGLTGWHSVTAATATTLTFPTPEMVGRNFTVSAPTVVRNIRVFGALDYDAALAHITIAGDNLEIDKAWLAITPLPTVRVNRSSSSRTQAVDLQHPGADLRQLMLDGFNVVMFAPTAGTAGQVKAIDLAQGSVLRAVLRTFQGLRMDRSELANAGGYTAVLESFGGALTPNRAIYAHQWTFQSPAFLTNEDAISPFEWTLLDDASLAAGTVPDNIAAVGSTSLQDLDFGGILETGVPGILHDTKPGALFGSFNTDTPP